VQVTFSFISVYRAVSRTEVIIHLFLLLCNSKKDLGIHYYIDICNDTRL